MKEFEKIGKAMPYRTPEGFFAEQAAELQQLAAQYTQEQSAQATKGRLQPLLWVGGVAAALLVGVVLSWGDRALQPNETTPNEPLYAYNETMSSDELESWVEYYEADLFLAE